MKKQFTHLKMDIYRFDEEDVLTTSDDINDNLEDNEGPLVKPPF